jgi:transcription antitermination factor NusG
VPTTADVYQSDNTDRCDALYALYTRHQHEKAATTQLQGRGFEVFLPLYKAFHRWKDRNQTVQLPLFPCYVFLRTALTRRGDILRTPGVLSIVGNGGRATAIPEAEIEAIRRVTHTRTHFEPHAFLKAGERVRILSGPLTGIEGILQRVKSRYRIILSVELLQKAVAVEVDIDAVERVNLILADSLGAPELKYAKP